MTEIEDMDRMHFDPVIVEAKLNVDDFEITLERDVPGVERTDSLGEAGDGTVTVTYKPTGISGFYRYNVVPPDHLQFERDLTGNFFKTR